MSAIEIPRPDVEAWEAEARTALDTGGSVVDAPRKLLIACAYVHSIEARIARLEARMDARDEADRLRDERVGALIGEAVRAALQTEMMRPPPMPKRKP